MLDALIALRRYGFLGREFLAMLWYWMISDGPGDIEPGSKIVLEKPFEHDRQTITFTGDLSVHAEQIRKAISQGYQIQSLGVILHHLGQEYSCVIDGATLAVSSLKTPQTARVRSIDDMEGAVWEKIAMQDQAVYLIENAFEHYMILRTAPPEHTDKIQELITAREWFHKGEKGKGRTAGGLVPPAGRF